MKFTRKVEKLFSREAIESLYEHIARRTHPVSARSVLASLDQAKLAEFEQRYPRKPDSPKINRFANVAYWIRINVERAQDLWLDRTPPLQILDLGCGSGYFLYVCKFFGHRVLGLDVDEHQLFRDALALLGVERVIARIEPNTPLPNLDRRFDLITAHRICFQRIEGAASGKEWTTEHWQYFISDVRSRLLNPGGRLLLDFNPRPNGSSFFTPELRSFFIAQGARLLRSKAIFGTEPTKRPRFGSTAQL